MARFLIAVSSLLVLLPTIFAFPQNDLSQSNPTPEIKRWWDFKDAYTDQPRYFGAIEDCPAPSFYLDCNHCRCNQATEGVPSGPACTRMMCARVPQIYNFGENGQGCPAGRQFYHRCNSCKCGSDGVTASCTLMLCNEPSNESGETENEPSNEPPKKPGLKENEPPKEPSDKVNGNPGLIKQVVHPIVQGVRTSISNLGKGLKLW